MRETTCSGAAVQPQARERSCLGLLTLQPQDWCFHMIVNEETIYGGMKGEIMAVRPGHHVPQHRCWKFEATELEVFNDRMNFCLNKVEY